MNRKQRRAAAKNQTPQNIKAIATDQAKAVFNRELESLVNKSTKKAIVLALYAMRDEFDMGQKRLMRFVERYNKYAECVELGENGVAGQPKLVDIEHLIESETGIRIGGAYGL